MVGDTILPESSLIYYLENSKEYMGIMPSVRFKDIQRGVEVAKPVDEGDKVSWKKTSSVDRALCFDYGMIMQNYGINLEVDMGYIPEEQEPPEEQTKRPVPVQGSLDME